MCKTAEVYPVEEKWTVVVVMDTPPPPPISQLKSLAHTLLKDITVQKTLSTMQKAHLSSRLRQWRSVPSHFTELTMLPATLVYVKKNKRGLIDGIGKLSNFLFWFGNGRRSNCHSRRS